MVRESANAVWKTKRRIRQDSEEISVGDSGGGFSDGNLPGVNIGEVDNFGRKLKNCGRILR